MNGSAYRACVRLYGKNGVVVAEAGEACDRLPADAKLELLVAAGFIELAPGVQPAPVAAATREAEEA